MRLGYTLRASQAIVSHPRSGIERIRGRIDRHQDHRELARAGFPQKDVYDVTADWRPLLHRAIDAPWPCPETESFDKLWDATIADLRAAGLRVGIASYGGWNDGDRAQAEALWCLIAHMRPDTVAETGVARGLTTRVILEGLARNENGRLSSVDLPAVDSALHSEIAVAVPQARRSRWTYVPGTSRARLGPVVADLGELDIFVHDSLHTRRNLRFELGTAWPALRAGGVAVVDDIDHSLGFRAFVDHTSPSAWLAVRHATGNGLWGMAVKAPPAP